MENNVNLRKDNTSQISEKAKRYILAKDIKKYEIEQKQRQTSESVNVSLATGVPTDRTSYLQVEPKQEKSSNLHSHITLKGLQSSQNKQNVPTVKQFLSPIDIPKNKMSLNISPDMKRAISLSSSAAFQKAMPDTMMVNDSNMSASRGANFQVRKFVGPNPLQGDDLSRERNIFLEKNNPINHTMYKEFNIGPRVDGNGKLVQYTLVGQPQWFQKQKDQQDKAISKVRRSSQMQKESFSKGEEENKNMKNKSIYQSKASMENLQNTSFRNQYSLGTEKSFIMRPDTTQSVMKSQIPPKKKTLKKNEQTIEVSKDELVRELKQIEKRHQMSVQMENEVINHMPLEQKNIFTREERVLDNHQRHLTDWDKQINKLANISHKPPTDSCMLRGEQHRRKVEYSQAFDNLKTEDERFGKRIWYMYLRKYPKKKDENGEEEVKGSHRRYNTDGVTKNIYEEDSIKQTKQSKVIINMPTKEELQQNLKNKQKVKLRDLFDTNENTQSDIFSGFMTVTINDQNREIEVIRNAQDPYNFHLSSSSAFSAYKKTSSQFFIESKVRESQQKLKGKMVILEQPINDFMVIGKNKLESEKNSLLHSDNRLFTKLIQNEQNEDFGIKKRSSASSQNSGQLHFQQTSRSQQNEVISKDYDINELSRTGKYFFPNVVDRLGNVSTMFG